MAYFSFGENLDFPDFLQKKFYNINYWCEYFTLRGLPTKLEGNVGNTNLKLWVKKPVPLCLTPYG